MGRETDFIDLLRATATDPAARNLQDDCAVLKFGSETLVITHDIMAENTHFLSDTDPADVAWKLVAVNLSDLAAKGAEPLGVLLGFTLGSNAWDQKFSEGLAAALAEYEVPLLGGDTVGVQENRLLGLTALGRATHIPVPDRRNARAGDMLWVTGNLGDPMSGFTLAKGRSLNAIREDLSQDDAVKLLAAYERPQPLLKEGRVLAPEVTAMMDVSDGLLLDAQRMAQASGLAVEIILDDVPLSQEYLERYGSKRQAKMDAAMWGDDYQLLFAFEQGKEPPVAATCVGFFKQGEGLTATFAGEVITFEGALGFEHY